MLQQRTIKTLTRSVGVGLHSGQRVELTLRPAAPDTGIVSRRIDLPEPVDIAVCAEAVVDTRMASTIGAHGSKVHTVEHLMSACAGLGLDNLYVDITAEEVPILDGSAASFVFLLQSAGIELQNAPRRFLRIKRAVEVREAKGINSNGRGLNPFMATSCASKSTSPTRRWIPPSSARSSTWDKAITHATLRGHAPSASPRMWKCCAPTAWRSAGGSTTPS